MIEQIDYAAVVLDLRTRAVKLNTLAAGLEEFMAPAGAAEPPIIQTTHAEHIAGWMEAEKVAWPEPEPAPDPPLVHAAIKVEKPVTGMDAVEKARNERVKLVRPPEDDGIESKLSATQAILRALNERSLTPTELKGRVSVLRPGTSPALIDSTVHYLKSKNYVRKDATDGCFHVVDQRMQNGSQANAGV